MATGKETEFRGNDQKGRGVLKRLFLWSPSVDTVIAFLSVILITSLVYLSLTIIRQDWASAIIYGWIGQLGVCIIFPLYWTIVVRKGKLDALGITKKLWLISLVVGIAMAGFMWMGYMNQYGIGSDTLPGLLLGVVGLWEIFFCFGWLQLRFEEAFGIIPAIVLASLGYSIYHLGYPGIPVSEIVGFFVFGLFFAIIFRSTKNLLVLLPAWPICCLFGFKTVDISVTWPHAVTASITLPFMLLSIFIFYRIQLRRKSR